MSFRPTSGALRPRLGDGALTDRRAFLLGTAATSLLGCIPDGPLKRQPEWAPAKITGDWAVDSPENMGLGQDAVDEVVMTVFDPDRLPNIRSLLVARRGVLVVESYVVAATDRTRQSPLMSATKSVSSLLAGIAVERGDLSGLGATVGSVFSRYDPRAGIADIRLEDALTMRSGIAYENGDFSVDMEWGGFEDSVAHILDKPQVDPPGSHFHYTDACAHIAGAFTSEASGEALEDYARRHLLGPAGIRDFSWLRHPDGRNFGAYGLFLTPRNLLRLTQACVDSSLGHGPVSQSWMSAATSFSVEPDFGEGADYGYLFWVRPEEGMYCAAGHGGQFAYAVPELELAVAITADPNSNEHKISVREEDAHDLVKRLADSVR